MRTRNKSAILGLCVAMMAGGMVLAQSTVAPSGSRGGGSGGMGGMGATGGMGGVMGGFGGVVPGESGTSAGPSTVRTGRSGAASFPPPSREDGPSCAFNAVIYSVKIPTDQIAKVDPDELNKAAAQVDDFEKALAKIGKIKSLYRADQTVMLRKDAIQIGARVPYITNSVADPSSRTGLPRSFDSSPRVLNTVTSSDIGARVEFSSSMIERTDGNLKLKIELMVLADSTTTISDGIKAPIFRSTTLAHNSPIQVNKPFVIMSIDSTTPDADSAATAYIAWVKLGELKLMPKSQEN